MKSQIYDRSLQDIAVFMFKVKNKHVPKYLSDLFTVNIIILV